MIAFAATFTAGLYVSFKEPFNALSWLFLAVGLCAAGIVWFFKKREQSTQELLEQIKPAQDGEDNNEENSTENTENAKESLENNIDAIEDTKDESSKND